MTESGSSSGCIYLNNAAEGWPKVPGVAAAIGRAINLPPLSSGRVAGGRVGPALDCRQRIATLLEVPDPRRIVLTHSATHALNLAIHGLALKPQSVVITTVTEHNSVLRPLFLMEGNRQVKIITIGLDACGALDHVAFERALSERPALVVINHGSNVTGRVQPVERLFALAKNAGAATLLDASQTIGHIPVLPIKFGADLVAFPGYKGLHGPPGTGALYVDALLDLEQIIVGGTGHHSQSRSHPGGMPDRLEAGTPNLPCQAGLAAALAWHAEHGEGFRECMRQNGNRLREGLRSIPNVSIVDDEPQADRLGLVSFLIDGWPVDEVGLALLDSFGIACRTGLHCAPLIHEALKTKAEGTVRLSPSGFNTEAEMQDAVASVAMLAHSRWESWIE